MQHDNALLDVLRRAKNGAAEWSPLVSSGVEVVKNNFLQVGLHFLHLAEDDTAFAFDLLLTELRILQDVRQDFYSLVQILRQTLGVEDSLFPGCVGIQVSSHVLNLKL